MSVTANWTGTCLHQDGSYWPQAMFNGTLDKDGHVSNVPLNQPTCAYEADLSMDFNLTASKIKPWEIATLLANLTQSDSAMKQAYCLNPSPDDDCSTWELCPQPDVSGPMVTFAALITHSGLAILLWLEQDIVEAFWSHMFTISALVTTTFISTASGQLARSHAFAAGMLIASPPTLYIWFCAVRACVKGAQPTRLDDIVGRLLGRCVALASMFAWFVLAGLVGSPSDSTIFSQRRCGGEDFLRDTLGVDILSYVLWGVLLASFALPWAASRWYRVAVRSPKMMPLADRLAAPWVNMHPLAQFGLLALVPTIVLGLLFRHPIQNLAKMHEFSNVWKAWQPLAFLVYTWVPLFFWTLVAFWRRYVAWAPADQRLSAFWGWLPRIVRFAIVVGIPSGAWLAVVFPNMANPTGAWISYGQLLALFATAPVFVGVARALFVARIEPWLERRRGMAAPADDEKLPLRHAKESTTESEEDPLRSWSPPGSSPPAQFENERAGLYGDAQMLERRSFQADISVPNTPYFDLGFNHARHTPAV